MCIAIDTLRQVGDWRKWKYRAEELYSNDIDHPDNWERQRRKHRARARRKEDAAA